MKKILTFFFLISLSFNLHALSTFYVGVSFHKHPKSAINPNEYHCLAVIEASGFGAKSVVYSIREFLDLMTHHDAISHHIELITGVDKEQISLFLNAKYPSARQLRTCVKLEDFFYTYLGRDRSISLERYKHLLTEKMVGKSILKSNNDFDQESYVLRKNLSTFVLLHNDWRDQKLNWQDLYDVKDVNHYLYLAEKFLIFFKYVRYRHPHRDYEKEFIHKLYEDKIIDLKKMRSNFKSVSDTEFSDVLKKVDEYSKLYEERNGCKINLGHIKRVMRLNQLVGKYQPLIPKDLKKENFGHPLLKKTFYDKEFEHGLNLERRNNNNLFQKIKDEYQVKAGPLHLLDEGLWKTEELFKKNQESFRVPEQIKTIGKIYSKYDKYFTETITMKIMEGLSNPTLRMLIPLNKKKRDIYSIVHTLNGIITLGVLAFEFSSISDFGLSLPIFQVVSASNEFIFSLADSFTFREKIPTALVRGSIRYIVATLENFIPIVSNVNQLMQGINDIRVGLQFNQKLKYFLSHKRDGVIKIPSAKLGDPMVLLMLRERLIYLQKGLIVQGLFLYRNINYPENVRIKLRYVLKELLEKERYLMKYLSIAKFEYELQLLRGRIPETILADTIFFLQNEYNFNVFSLRAELDEYSLIKKLEQEIRKQ